MVKKMNKLEELKKMINDFFDKNYSKEETLNFSMNLEDFICDNFDEMVKEDKDLTLELNEEMPDICATYIRGDDPEPFKKLLKKEYDRVFTQATE